MARAIDEFAFRQTVDLLTASEATGIDPGILQQWVIRRQVYARRDGRFTRVHPIVRGLGYLPLWQFAGGEPIPSLASVLSALPENFTVSQTWVFAHRTVITAEAGDIALPLLMWLAFGGDPAPALEAAQSAAELI